MHKFILLILFSFLIFPSLANADCANPAGIEGDQLYNSTHKTMQFCDGETWYSMKGGAPAGGGGFIPACKADMSNIQIGDTCDDGSKYVTAGLYVTDVNQSTSSNWYNAVGMCRDLYRHGHYDWELPSKGELDQLYVNRSAIGGFTTRYYWSSSEINSSGAWRQDFSNGGQGNNSKSSNLAVRCVRRN